MSKIAKSIAFVGAHGGNYGAARNPEAIKYLVYHYTGNDGDTAMSNALYYQDHVVKASAHYFVDDNVIVQSVEDLTTAWAVGGGRWSDCAKTGGGKLYGVVTNGNSLSIEMCDTRRDGQIMATEQTLANAAALGKLLMTRYSIPLDHVVRHFDVTGKHCPAYFMDEAAWQAFKQRLKEDAVEIFESMADVSARAPWATETIAKLIERGAIRGSGKRDVQGRPADMGLTLEMVRTLVIIDRAGGF